MRAGVLKVQGAASSAGKSLLVADLCLRYARLTWRQFLAWAPSGMPRAGISFEARPTRPPDGFETHLDLDKLENVLWVN